MDGQLWPAVTDDDQVERLISALQLAVASASGAANPRSGMVEASAPDLANALLLLLASVLEGSPTAITPSGMRRLAEAAGKELHALMRDARRVRLGHGTT